MGCGTMRQRLACAAALLVLATGSARADDGKPAPAGALPPALHDKGCTFYEDTKWGAGTVVGVGEPLRVVVTQKGDGSDDKNQYTGYASLAGGPWEGHVGAMICDNSEELRCQAQLFSRDEKLGDKVMVWTNALTTLDDVGWKNKAVSLLVGCAVLK